MASANPQIVIFDGDVQSARRLERAFSDAALCMFSVAHLPAGRVRAEPGFDAIYLTLPAAERWNARPVEGLVQVKRTNDDDRREGWPAYVLAGLVLSAADASDAERAVQLWAQALLKAILENGDLNIFRIKVPISMIPAERLSAECVAQALADAERDVP